MENENKKIEEADQLINIKNEKKDQKKKEKPPKASLKSEIFSWVKLTAFALGIAFFINTVIIVNASVPTGSMRPTIESQSRLFAFRLSYLFSDPERLDVIVFNSPDGTRTRYVKRIIGMPGETVDIISGQVFIDGSAEPLDEWYLLEPPAGPSFTPQSFVVPEGSFFVMGDNRNDSQDSRGLGRYPWNNLFVPQDNIMGRALFMYFPRISGIR